MQKELQESVIRQNKTEAAVLGLQTQLGEVMKTHGADIEMLQQDMEQVKGEEVHVGIITRRSTCSIMILFGVVSVTGMVTSI